MQVHVTTDPDGEIARQVYRLRYQVYVQEMGLALEPSGGPDSLRDRLDDHSVLLLLTRCGENVGTVRVSFGDDCELELEGQNEPWAGAVAAVRRRGETVAEMTRLMLVSRYRGGAALPSLLMAACEAGADRGDGRLFIAGKDGPLSRLYEGFGARVVDDRLLPYRVQGVTLGHYRLLGIDSGRLSATRDLLRTYAWAAGDQHPCAGD
jgi:hypothetical protein